MSGGAQTLDASRRISNFFASKCQIYIKRRFNFRIGIFFTRFYRQNKGKMYNLSLILKFDRRQRTNPTKIEFVLFDSAHLFAIGIIKTSLTQPFKLRQTQIKTNANVFLSNLSKSEFLTISCKFQI